MSEKDTRYAAAQSAAGKVSPADEQGLPRPYVHRHGLAEIVSNDGGGNYTITAQVWDDDGAAWEDSDDDGMASASARDVSALASGSYGDKVYFWEQDDAYGGVELLIDLRQSAGIAGGVDKWIRWTDAGDCQIDAGDWRGKAFDVRCLYYGGNVSNANTSVWTDIGYVQVAMVGASSSGLETVYLETTPGGSTVKVQVKATGELNANVTNYSSEFQLRVLIGPVVPSVKNAADLEGPES